MNVSLTPQLEKLVEDKVKSGRYTSASEVIREALRLLEEQEQLRQMRIEHLRKEVAIGLAELDRGEEIDGEEVFREVRRKIAETRQQRGRSPR